MSSEVERSDRLLVSVKRRERPGRGEESQENLSIFYALRLGVGTELGSIEVLTGKFEGR